MEEKLDSNTDPEMQAKLDYLQQEIANKNYDQQAFVNYCLREKENGDDLNNWTMEELKAIITKYQNSKNAKNVEKNEKEAEDAHVETNVNTMEKTEVIQKQKLEFKIKCRTLEKTELNGQKLEVKVQNPKEMEKGVLANSYILYEVLTMPLNKAVTRRYSDFDWLRRTLVKMNPGFNVPPLPNKKMGNRRFDTDFIAKRMKFLNLFINSVVEIEEFKSCDALVCFLTYEDRGKFEQKMKELTSFQPSNYVEEYKTLDGNATISHDEGNEKYFTNISKYFRLQTQLLDKLNFNIKQFYRSMNEAADALADVQKNFEILYILNSRVLMKPVITNTYEELGFFFKNWKKIIIKQNELVKSKVKEFFKFINLEGKAYSELIANRETLNQKYSEENRRVNAKKEKIFATGDINKFEISPDDKNVDKQKLISDKEYSFQHICYKDSQAVKLLYNQLGYVNKMNIRELKKMIRVYCERFMKNFTDFDGSFYCTINDLIASWTNMETFLRTTESMK